MSDTLHEVVYGYYNLKKLDGEASLFRDDIRQQRVAALKNMQTLSKK
jgi:hypothetical protein